MRKDLTREEVRKIRDEVISMCMTYLHDLMQEDMERKKKKMLAQKILATNGIRQTRTRPYLKIRFEILKRDDFKCVYCGRGAEEVILEIDHVNPVNFGGDSKLENLVVACKDCNIGKKDFLLNERQEEKLKSQNRLKADATKVI